MRFIITAQSNPAPAPRPQTPANAGPFAAYMR